jgi:hypothetical protein
LKAQRLSLFTTVASVLLLLALFSSLPAVQAQDVNLSYKLVNIEDGTFSYNLNVVVPQSLTEHYSQKNHLAVFDSSFPKFVTPSAVEPLADCLRQIYPDDEDFVNGVLTLVHQIPYKEVREEYYPVETLVRGSGDCDLFSFLAASILKAGGLDVRLLHYTVQEHMNLGVHLEQPPNDARGDLYSFDNEGKTYYVAECTSSSWQDGWRVGECPEELQNVSMIVISLENSEPTSPGHVSASFTKLQSTTLRMGGLPIFASKGTTVKVNGQIVPALPNQNITLYLRTGFSWRVLTTTTTSANGQFTYVWDSNLTGLFGLRASWSGDDQYAGAISQTQNTLILPFYFLVLASAATVAVGVCVVVFVITRKSRQKTKVQPPPKAPDFHEA